MHSTQAGNSDSHLHTAWDRAAYEQLQILRLLCLFWVPGPCAASPLSLRFSCTTAATRSVCNGRGGKAAHRIQKTIIRHETCMALMSDTG